MICHKNKLLYGSSNSQIMKKIKLIFAHVNHHHVLCFQSRLGILYLRLVDISFRWCTWPKRGHILVFSFVLTSLSCWRFFFFLWVFLKISIRDALVLMIIILFCCFGIHLHFCSLKKKFALKAFLPLYAVVTPLVLDLSKARFLSSYYVTLMKYK